MSVEARAGEMIRHMEIFQRDGEPRKIWRVKEGAPSWIQDVVRDAHTEMLPDDWIYEFTVDALHAISDNAEEARDYIETSIYNHDLFEWLASHANRPAYCQEAWDEMDPQDFMECIRSGQWMERSAVLDNVLESLEELVRSEEESEEESDA